MARGYPRFLFSDPQNVTTPGPFVVHTLYPRFIATIYLSTEPREYLIECWDDINTSQELDSAVDRMRSWITAQINSGEIKL